MAQYLELGNMYLGNRLQPSVEKSQIEVQKVLLALVRVLLLLFVMHKMD